MGLAEHKSLQERLHSDEIKDTRNKNTSVKIVFHKTLRILSYEGVLFAYKRRYDNDVYWLFNQ